MNNAIKKVEDIINKKQSQESNGEERTSLHREDAKADTLKKEERQKEKDFIKREKKHIKEQKKANRNNGENNKKKGKLVTAVVCLSVLSVLLVTALTMTLTLPTPADRGLEIVYQKSFYDTVQQVDNIDLNLSKALVCKDSEAMQKYLMDTAINSELCENDLQQMPLEDESKFYTTKLVNQIGDFSKYLSNKIVDGESLTESDYNSLYSLYSANLTLKSSLQKMVNGMDENFSFTRMGENNIVIENFNELQNLSVEYPELIYDGPFSDSVNEREIKGLQGDDIDEQTAQNLFITAFKDYHLKNIQSQGETNTDIACYNVQGEKEGNVLYAQFSKKGGHLILFAYSGSCKDTKYSAETAIETGTEFLSGNGLTNMSPVWSNLANNVYTINYVYNDNGILVYPDMVKVRICAETNMVIGFEGSAYYTNHTSRTISEASIGKSTALSKVSDNITVKGTRLVVIPIGTQSEKLAYEIYGEYDEATYYVYIDALTGKQVQMFKVVTGTEGEYLM